MMPKRVTSERIERLLDAYGAHPHRWPHDERSQALARLEELPELRGQRRQALKLDLLLDQATLPQASRELLDDVHAVAEASGWGRWLASLWPFGPIWKPAVGLSMATVTGVILGLVNRTPAELAQITHEIEVLILG